MTANIAWIHGDDVFLIADSSLTRAGSVDPARAVTSIGQPARVTPRGIVEEGAAKLYRVGRNLVAALCGDAESAVGFLRTFASGPSTELELAEAAARAHDQVRHIGRSFEITFALHAGGKPRIAVYSSDQNALHDETELGVWACGSLSSTTVERVVVEILGLRQASLEPADRLVAGLAFAQSLGIHNDLIAEGIGGAFFGARVGPDGVRWQDDTTFVLYQPDFDASSTSVQEGHDLDEAMRDGSPAGESVRPLEFIGCRVRDDALTVVSTLNAKALVITSDIAVPDLDAWASKWGHELADLRTLRSADRLAFIPMLEGSLLVVPNDGQFFKWTPAGHFAFRDDLVRRLKWRPSSEKARHYEIHVRGGRPTQGRIG